MTHWHGGSIIVKFGPCALAVVGSVILAAFDVAAPELRAEVSTAGTAALDTFWRRCNLGRGRPSVDVDVLASPSSDAPDAFALGKCAHGNKCAGGLWKCINAVFEASIRGGKGAEPRTRRGKQHLLLGKVRRMPHATELHFDRSTMLAVQRGVV